MDNGIPIYSNLPVKLAGEDIHMKAYYARSNPLLRKVISQQKN